MQLLPVTVSYVYYVGLMTGDIITAVVRKIAQDLVYPLHSYTTSLHQYTLRRPWCGPYIKSTMPKI